MKNRRMGEGRDIVRALRASSIKSPKETTLGQAVSHALQSRHDSMCAWYVPDAGIAPSATARIICVRPRGESISVPTTTFLGHVGTQ